ncbi:MAG: two-component system response regulator BtsR [Gammaproteobacteria bacterium]|nr:two-component system response regulator BtsR [Gammaproteobacteria bacterium]MCF6259249.1 two-component system response regulator BtsR [Gammaproteobacteria bacterium]
MIRTIIVDDEPNAREDLEKKIKADPEFDVIGTSANAFEAIKDINNKHPDVVFLDIQMPRISGVEMLSMLDKDNMPRIVFVTAHGEYAIEAFKKNAIDFLLKPVKDDRLHITLARLKENHQPQPVVTEALSTELTFVPCYQGSRYYLINVKEIIHAYSNPMTGVHLVTGDSDQEFQTNLPLKVFDDNSQLKRCHRQHMINPDYIKFIEKLENGLGQISTYGNHTIPVSRNFMDKFPAIA